VLTVMRADSSWSSFLPGLLVAMVGTGILNPIVSRVALSSASPEQSGLAARVNDMFRQAGIAPTLPSSMRSSPVRRPGWRAGPPNASEPRIAPGLVA
jgi:hypothetical protein